MQRCEEVLEFSERSTSHDAPTSSGHVRFMRACDLAAEVTCVPCGYPVCTHHHWSRHAEHHVTETA